MYYLSEKIDILDKRIVNTIRACKDQIRHMVGKTEMQIVLYGSQARADAEQDSDLDLLVLVPDSVNLTQKRAIHDAIYEIGLDNDVVVSVIITTHRQWESPVTQSLPLYKNITQEGIRVV